MKKILIATAVATAFVAPTTFAQSAFQGFYGQIATGYESNSVSGTGGNITDTPATPGVAPLSVSSSNQTFGTAPLVLGLGYNFSVAPQWLVGVGVDYSAISQTSSTYSRNISGGTVSDTGWNTATANGSSIKLSNRFNIFVTPGYAIDKDKLVYLKAGYSSVSIQQNGPTSLSVTSPSSAVGTQSVAGFSNPSATLSGYVVGLGYKQIITGGLYGFAEGNYMGYSSKSLTSSKAWTDGTGTSNVNSNPNLSSYQLLVGVGYKF